MTTVVHIKVTATNDGVPATSVAHDVALLLIEHVKKSDDLKSIGDIVIDTGPLLNNTTEFGQVNDPAGLTGITDVIPFALANILEEAKHSDALFPESISNALAAAGDLSLATAALAVHTTPSWSDKVVEARKTVDLSTLIAPGTKFRELAYRETALGKPVISIMHEGTIRQYVPA